MKFLVIIPHYGDDEYLVRCMKSLGCENFSLSGEVAQLEKISDELDVYIYNNNIHNVGFTEANNCGIRYGMDEKVYNAFWLLNNDTEVEDVKGALRAFYDELVSHPDTAIIGCKIVSLEDPDFIHHAGTGACVPAGVHKVGRVSAGQYETRTLERWVTGASMVVSARIVREIGVLDKNMVNYGSDSDYCFRARAAGYRVIYLPVTVRHRIGQSAHPSPTQMKVLRSDMLYFQAKWMYGKVFFDLDKEQFNEN